ncbi:MAG: hypothetical protein DMG08_25320 [Acidobacteria bacterium]|nr:MAG: hypothetical protein DMG08_25320 [Acidobacteriota bacterium]PYV02563.1 MAG: hypothetical protein DMG10_14205 [Acidobacteriota bacterium]
MKNCGFRIADFGFKNRNTQSRILQFLSFNVVSYESLQIGIADSNPQSEIRNSQSEIGNPQS